MRLSEIKGERALDVIAEVIEPICNIAQDKTAAELFKRSEIPEGVSTQEYVLNRWKKTLPKLLKGHKADIIAIGAAIEGITTKEYADKMSIASLIVDGANLVTDEVFQQLFLSQMQTQTSSGSAQEVTPG